MNKRKVTINIRDYPEALRELLSSGEVYDSSCHSSAKTLYCDSGFYIKSDSSGTLAREAEMCRRFHGLGLGVECVAYLTEDRDYLVTKEARGEALHHFMDDPRELCRALAGALRELHSRPVADAPESVLLTKYRQIAAGEQPEGDFDAIIRKYGFDLSSKEEAWELVQAYKDKLKADTFIHGDACLPNIMRGEDDSSIFIDVGNAGLGDKHMDLFWAVWSLRYNLKTDAYGDYFLDQYGRENFDYEMLRVVSAFEVFG